MAKKALKQRADASPKEERTGTEARQDKSPKGTKKNALHIIQSLCR